MDFATVFKTFNSAEANLIVAQLEAAGFEPTIVNEFATLTLAPASTAGGIRVEVPESQATDARALLNATVNANTDVSSDSTPA